MTTEASQSHYQYVVDEIKKVENVRKVDSLMSDMKLLINEYDSNLNHRYENIFKKSIGNAKITIRGT